MKKINDPKNRTQTKLTPQVMKSLYFLSDKKFPRKSLFRAAFFIARRIKKEFKRINDESERKKLMRRRDAAQIIQDKTVTGCADIALVFLAIIRRLGFKARWVETIKRRWMEQGGEKIEGHIFIEIYHKNEWWIFDPDEAAFLGWYSRWIVVARGEDSWDIGISNFEKLRKKLLNFKIEKSSIS